MKSNPAASARWASATNCLGPACSPITVYPNDTMARSSHSKPKRAYPILSPAYPAGSDVPYHDRSC